MVRTKSRGFNHRIWCPVISRRSQSSSLSTCVKKGTPYEKHSLIIMSIINEKILRNWIQQVFDKCVGPMVFNGKIWQNQKLNSASDYYRRCDLTFGEYMVGIFESSTLPIGFSFFLETILMILLENLQLSRIYMRIKDCEMKCFQILHINPWLWETHYLKRGMK